MFKKEDYQEYFESIKKLEQDMVDYCDRMLKDLSDEESKALVSRIRKEEVAHVRLSENLLGMLDET